VNTRQSIGDTDVTFTVLFFFTKQSKLIYSSHQASLTKVTKLCVTHFTNMRPAFLHLDLDSNGTRQASTAPRLAVFPEDFPDEDPLLHFLLPFHLRQCDKPGPE
jgi:hypothetical protein